MQSNNLHLIDTHCHLYHKQFHQDWPEVCQRAVEAGVKTIFLPAITMESIAEMQKLHHPGLTLYPMAGIHPCEVTDQTRLIYDRLSEQAHKADVVGVGETGLDYYWSKEWVAEQQESFRFHCQLARETGKAIVIHNRESTEDLFKLLQQEQDGRLKGVWHCFNGTYEQGLRAIDLGLHLGLGGVLTYKNAGVAEAVRELPLDRLMLETDAPYLSPVPHRGQRNEPAYTRLVAEKLAEIKGLSLEEIAQITSVNARRLFLAQEGLH
jgi:TatD DNase family protein